MAFCCCSSATGAKVIAILSLICSILGLLVFGSFAVFGAIRSERMNPTEEAVLLATGFLGSVVKDNELFQAIANQTGYENETITIDGEVYVRSNVVEFFQRSSAYLSLNFSILYVVLSVYSLVASIELLQGVRQRNYWRCNIWQRWYAAAMIASFACQILLVIFVSENFVYKLVNAAIGWAIAFYFYFVVHGFIKELETEEENGKGGKK